MGEEVNLLTEVEVLHQDPERITETDLSPWINPAQKIIGPQTNRPWSSQPTPEHRDTCTLRLRPSPPRYWTIGVLIIRFFT